MGKIDSIEKALEYLAMHQSGKISDLDKIEDNLIQKIVEAELLTSLDGDYIFSQEGVDFYCQEYGVCKNQNFMGF